MTDDLNDDSLRDALDRLSSAAPVPPDRLAAVHGKATRLRHRRAALIGVTAAAVVAAAVGIAVPAMSSDGKNDSSNLRFTHPSPNVSASTSPTPTPRPSIAVGPPRATLRPPVLVKSLSSGSYVSTSQASAVGIHFNAYLPSDEAQPSSMFGAVGTDCRWGKPDPSPRAAGGYTYWKSSGDFEDSGVVLTEFLIVAHTTAEATATLNRVNGWLRACDKAFRPVQSLDAVGGEVFLHSGSLNTARPVSLPGYTATGRSGNVVALVDYSSQGEAPAGGASQGGMAKAEAVALAQAQHPVSRARAVPAAENDIDGDGRADAVSIKPARKGAAYNFVLTAHLTSLGTRTAHVDATTEGGQLIGIGDMDGDGYSEIVVRFDHGASTEFWTIIRLVNGNLLQMTQDGSPVSLPVGGSALHKGSFDCNANDPGVWTPGFLLETGYSSEDAGKTWTGRATKYRYDAARLVQVSKHSETWTGNVPSKVAKYGDGPYCGAITRG